MLNVNMNVNASINGTASRAPSNEAAAASATSLASAASGDDPAGFASLLRQTQAPAEPVLSAAPKASPSAPATHTASAGANDADDAKPATASTDPQAGNSAETTGDTAPAAPDVDTPAASRSALRSRLRGLDAAPATQALDSPDTPADATSRKARDTETAKADKASHATDSANAAPPLVAVNLDPSVMHWLANQPRASASGAVLTVKADATNKAPPDDRSATPVSDTPGSTEARSASASRTTADVLTDTSQDKAALAKAALGLGHDASFAAVASEQRLVGEKAFAPVAASTAKTDASLAAAGLMLPTPAGTSANAPVTVALATPVSAPDFAQALGVQMSMLAVDGVQHAELHLNPAEMGPVSVQIVMDGTQAHVDFGADAAATRQAIEAGLPELASALRDAGFTLAGGGVSQHSQHSRGRSDGGGTGGDANASGSDKRQRAVSTQAIGSVAAAARRVVTAGGVDVFA